MSNSLKFTLKQLLDLGIICSHKKKKRREPIVQRSVNIAAPPSRFIPGQGQYFPQQSNPYSDPFDPNRYTYGVQLREERDRKLIRKLQEKQQQQAFQSAVRENFRRLDIGGENEVIRGIAEPEEDIYGDFGYAREDMNGYFGRTATDDEFKSQQVGAVERFPGEARYASGSGFSESEDAGYFSAREDFGMAPEEMQQEEGFGPAAKEGGFDPDQPPTSERVRQVRRSADFYRGLYEELAGSQADPFISKNTKAAPIKAAYIKLLLRDYRELGGTDRDILRSKNIDTIRDEVAKMMVGKKKSP
jgi:hypothetical protein